MPLSMDRKRTLRAFRGWQKRAARLSVPYSNPVSGRRTAKDMSDGCVAMPSRSSQAENKG